MLRSQFLWLVILLIISSGACKEIAYVFGENNHPAGEANITEYRGTDMVSFTVAAGPGGTSASHSSQRRIDSIKDEINKKIDRGNQSVRTEGLNLVGSKSGPRRIDQICSIYDYLVGNWTFVDDWRGLEQFQYAGYTLEMGREAGTSGKGDCDDFSILLSSLIESIGATPRIILAHGPAGGHAYAEVYLGKMGNQDKDLDRMLRWLRSKYNVDEINTHTDLETGEVWLNMDWWKDTVGAKHPGGPFYHGAEHIPIYIQEDMPKTPLTPIENLLPQVSFTYTPIEPEVGAVVNFDAAQTKDPDGRVVDYEWSFGDGDTSKGPSKSAYQHPYLESGKFLVNLTVTDNDGDRSSKILEVNVREPLPEALFTYSPEKPNVGDYVRFDASQSKDKRGKIVKYEWDFGDGYTGKGVSITHPYWDSGTYCANLTVKNDKGVENITSKLLVVDPSENKETPFLTQEEAGPLTTTFYPEEMTYPRQSGTLLATACEDHIARIWDAKTGLDLQRLAHNDMVLSVAFSPDGTKVASGSLDTTARIWDAKTGLELQKLNDKHWVNSVAFSPDGTKVATASWPIARIWNTNTGSELLRLSHDDFVNSVTFSPDGTKVATASDDRTARIWDTNTGSELLRLSHDDWVNSVTFSPDGTKVATASDDKTARIWNANTGSKLHSIEHGGSVYSVAFSPDGTKVATASGDKTARIWDATTGSELHRLEHDDSVNSVAFSPDGTKVATASGDKTARIWDANTGSELLRLEHDKTVRSVAFSPN